MASADAFTRMSNAIKHLRGHAVSADGRLQSRSQRISIPMVRCGCRSGRVREFQTRYHALARLSTSCKMEIESGIMDQLAY
jgi:hypothetical protein